MNSAGPRLNRLAVFAFLLLLTTLIVGCGGDKGVNPNDGSISGRVYKAGTNYPVSGAQVKCAGQLTSTDYDGAYEIKNLPLGSHTLTASKENYEYFSAEVNITGKTTRDIYIKTAKSDSDGDDEE